MEDKQLNEKESLELIALMIRNTQKKMEKGSGIPFLIWGYVTIAVSLTVWYLLGKTGNQHWNFLWFAIPIIGFPVMLLVLKKKKTTLPKTYIDKIINYVWIVMGISALIPSMAATVIHNFPVLFLVVLLISAGTAMTGLVIKFKPLVISGFGGMLLSILCLILRESLDSILVFAALFLLVQVIPGHILNYKNRKNHV